MRKVQIIISALVHDMKFLNKPGYLDIKLSYEHFFYMLRILLFDNSHQVSIEVEKLFRAFQGKFHYLSQSKQMFHTI